MTAFYYTGMLVKTNFFLLLLLLDLLPQTKNLWN